MKIFTFTGLIRISLPILRFLLMQSFVAPVSMRILMVLIVSLRYRCRHDNAFIRLKKHCLSFGRMDRSFTSPCCVTRDQSSSSRIWSRCEMKDFGPSSVGFHEIGYLDVVLVLLL